MSIKDILKLPPSERLSIAERIWESLKSEDLDLTQKQKDELDERMKEDQRGKMNWYAYDEVLGRLSKKK